MRISQTWLTLALSVMATLLVAGCGDFLLPRAAEPEQTLEGPLNELTGVQLVTHAIGDGEFSRHFTPASGLVPLFVATSCASCHVADGRGHPVFNITRFGRQTNTGFDPLEAEGGPQLCVSRWQSGCRRHS